MLNLIKIKTIRENEDKRRILANFTSLSLLQGANYILPLITFPYLVRVLGVEKWGLLAFASATTAYFQILTDYGFNLSATREISINRENKEKVKEIFSSVMIIKFALLILSFILLTMLVFNFEKFRQDWLVYYFTFGIVVGQTLFPVWFFQGMERMKYITVLNLISRGLSTAAVFIFIKQRSDYIYVPLINLSGFILAGIMSLSIVRKNFGVWFTFIRADSIRYQLKEGWYIFTSTVAISLYTISTPFILGLLTNNTVVGYYSAADKIIQAVKSLMGPLSQSLYPYIVSKVNTSREIGLRIIKKLTKFVALFTGVLSAFIFLFAASIVNLVLGREYANSIIVLQILSIHPFLTGLSNIFGIQTMLSFDRKKAFQNIIISASILNIVLTLILVPLFRHIGSAISVTVTELFVTLSTLIYLQKTGIEIIGAKNV